MAEVKLKEQHRPSSGSGSLHVKEEPEESELSLKEEPGECPLHMFTVKTEDDKDKSSVLHQRATVENREETNGSSSDTDHSEDYSQEQVEQKRSYAMIPPDSHMSLHSGERPHKCPFCEKQFTHKCRLTAHMRIHTGEKPFVCSVCDKPFAQKPGLTLHMRRVHTGERPHGCSVCKHRFSGKHLLTNHQRSVHRMCPVCGARFRNEMTLNAHLRTHVEEGTLAASSLWSFSCSECGRTFPYKALLQKHMLFHTREKPFKCSICERCFTQKSSLNYHMKSHSGENQMSVRPLCPVCKGWHTEETKLDKCLMKSQAPQFLEEENMKPFSCSECGRRFRSTSALQSHMTVHTDDQPHSCSVCKKPLKQKYLHNGLTSCLQCLQFD